MGKTFKIILLIIISSQIIQAQKTTKLENYVANIKLKLEKLKSQNKIDNHNHIKILKDDYEYFNSRLMLRTHIKNQ